MSTITGLISAGGAGGGATNIVTDPTHLFKGVTSQASIDFKYGTTLYDPSSTTYYTNLANYGFGYWAECATADTYVTVADITSATNGGFAHCFVGAATLQGESTTFKFTVDGTATEITYTNSGGGSSTHRCPVIGGFYMNPQTTADQSPFNTAELSVLQGGWVLEDTSSNFYASNTTYGLGTPSISHFMDLPRLRFESSFKLEVKKSVIGGTAVDNRASAIITLS